MRGLEQGRYGAIRSLKKARVHTDSAVEKHKDHWLLTTKLHNTSAWPSLAVRLKAVRETTGDRILPAIYDDNYVALMPGESRSITIEINHADTRGEKPTITLEGFNVEHI
jgi:hypothetical protein